MKFIKNRFFHNTSKNIYFVETIEWILSGTDGVSLNDPRAVPIGQSRPHPQTGLPWDSWIPVSISNPGCSIVNHTYNTEQITHIEPGGQASSVPKNTTIANYAAMDVYSQPLMSDTVEISMSQYNSNIQPYPF